MESSVPRPRGFSDLEARPDPLLLRIFRHVFSAAWDLIRATDGIALRWLCLGALVRRLSWSWTASLLGAWILSLVLPHVGLALSSLESARGFVGFLYKYPDIRFIETSMPADWYRRRWIWKWIPQQFPAIANANPLRILAARPSSLLKLMSFISGYSTAVIVVREGPTSKMGAIERFNLYHEVAHCCAAGLTQWMRKFAAPLTIVLGIVPAMVISAVTPPWTAALASFCILSAIIYWRFSRHEYLEYWAMVWP